MRRRYRPATAADCPRASTSASGRVMSSASTGVTLHAGGVASTGTVRAPSAPAPARPASSPRRRPRRSDRSGQLPSRCRHTIERARGAERRERDCQRSGFAAVGKPAERLGVADTGQCDGGERPRSTGTAPARPRGRSPPSRPRLRARTRPPRRASSGISSPATPSSTASVCQSPPKSVRRASSYARGDRSGGRAGRRTVPRTAVAQRLLGVGVQQVGRCARVSHRGRSFQATFLSTRCSAGQAQHAFGDDVAQDLRGAALDRVALRAQVPVAGFAADEVDLATVGASSSRRSADRPRRAARVSKPEIAWASWANASFIADPSGPGCPAASCWRSRSPVEPGHLGVDPQPHQRVVHGRVAQLGRDRRQASATLPIMPPSRGAGRRRWRRVRCSGSWSRPASPGRPRPSRLASGTRTSVRNTSLNSASPVIWRSGRISTPGCGHVEQEVGQASVLGHVRVGAGDQDRHLRVLRPRRPHLLPVDNPVVAVADGPGRHRGQVRAGARLAEQLAVDVLAGEQRTQETLALLSRAERGDRRRRHAQPDTVSFLRRPRRARGLECGIHPGLQRLRPAPVRRCPRRSAPTPVPRRSGRRETRGGSVVAGSCAASRACTRRSRSASTAASSVMKSPDMILRNRAAIGCASDPDTSAPARYPLILEVGVNFNGR